MGALYDAVAETLRQDGWENPTTGIGTSRDKTEDTSFSWDLRLNDTVLEALYHNSSMARRAVEQLPEYAMRQGYILQVPGPTGDKVVSGTQDALAELDAEASFVDAMCWGRLYGGGLLYIGADDGRYPNEPLNETNIRTISYVRALDRRDVIPQSWYQDPMHPNFGLPETYRLVIMPSAAGVPVLTNVVVHESRTIAFRGARTSLRVRRQMFGWDHSIIQAVWAELKSFAAVWGSIDNLVADASQAVFKIDGLIQALAEGDTQRILDRMALIDRTRSAQRAVVLDAGTEDFTRVPTPFAGLPELIDRTKERLASALGYPVTVLFGTSPGGMNATGESDLRNWYAAIKNYRRLAVAPRLRRLFQLIWLAKDGPTRGRIPKDWSLDFPSLWDMSPAEEAAVHAQQAGADVAYINAGVATAEEIATSRFAGAEGYALRTNLNLEAREALIETDAIEEKLTAAHETATAMRDMLAGEAPEPEEKAPIAQ